MYVPTAFRMDELPDLHDGIRAVATVQLCDGHSGRLDRDPTATLPCIGRRALRGLYGHQARPNPQWRSPPVGEAMAIFTGLDAYISPSWYASKREHGKVVPTWNYVAVHAYGHVEFFDDPDRLLDVVTRLTNLHERPRAKPWAVTDAPKDFIRAMLRGIIGLRLPITRLEGKRKMSQNRSAEDRAGVATALATSENAPDRAAAALIPA